MVRLLTGIGIIVSYLYIIYIYDDAAAMIFIMGRVIISMMGGVGKDRCITSIIVTAPMCCYPHRCPGLTPPQEKYECL